MEETGKDWPEPGAQGDTTRGVALSSKCMASHGMTLGDSENIDWTAVEKNGAMAYEACNCRQMNMTSEPNVGAWASLSSARLHRHLFLVPTEAVRMQISSRPAVVEGFSDRRDCCLALDIWRRLQDAEVFDCIL